MKKYLFVGGDTRRIFTAEYLRKNGAEVFFADSFARLGELIKQADFVVLPLPVSRDGVHIHSDPKNGLITLEEFVFLLKGGVTVFGGMMSRDFSEAVAAKGAVPCDYYEDEALAVLNSVSTAEGVIYEIIDNSKRNIHGASAAVFGYGRSASAVAKRLAALGAQVTALARSSAALARAEADGCRPVHISQARSVADELDFVVNTVPSPVIGADFISMLKKDCFIVEIASAPYGVDFDAAEKYGIRVIKAPSLPGRISPESAGEAVARTILKGVVTKI